MLRTEGFKELSPLHLVSRTSGSEVGPPCSGITKQLLDHKQHLLVRGIVVELELRLDGAKPMVSF
jgi:hypothetical protein